MFYENFNRICKTRCTSANAAVMAIGRPSGAASNWKANGTLPKEGELIALARHLGCRVSDFFREDGQTAFSSREEMVEYWRYVESINPLAREADGAAPDAADDMEAELVRMYRSLDVRGRIELLSRAVSLSER